MPNQVALEAEDFESEADLDKAIKTLETTIAKTKKSDLDLDGGDDVRLKPCNRLDHRLIRSRLNRMLPAFPWQTCRMKTWMRSSERRSESRRCCGAAT